MLRVFLSIWASVFLLNNSKYDFNITEKCHNLLATCDTEATI
uniref:Uncharacterized protein n=1 Tax=Rhizophora mucronata TaxID=61149 RepID=A0A2P2PFJ5_RHIMU